MPLKDESTAIKRRKRKRIILFKLVTILIGVFLFLHVTGIDAKAPDILNSITRSFTPKPKPITQSATLLSANTQSALEELASQEIRQDQAIVSLPVDSESSVVPTNSITQPLVGPFQEIFSLNPSAKNKIRLKKIDRLGNQLINLLKIDKSDKVSDKAVGLIQQIAQISQTIARDKAVQNDRDILTLRIEQYLRIKLDLQQVEDNLPIGSYLKVENARKKYLEKSVTDIVNNAENLDGINTISVKEVGEQVGEDFKELKVIEIISDFENISPDKQRILEGIQKQLSVQFENKMLKLPDEVRSRKLQNYINLSYGNPVIQIRTLNRMQNYMTDKEIILGLQSLRELAIKKLERRVFELTTPELESQFNDQVLNNPKDIKALIQIKLDVDTGTDENKKKIIAGLAQRAQDASIPLFSHDPSIIIAAFPTNKVPDLLDVVTVSKVNQVLGSSNDVLPEVKKTINGIRQKVLKNFVTNINTSGFVTGSKSGYNPVKENADVRLLLTDPRSILLLETIKNDLSNADKSAINLAERSSVKILSHSLLEHTTDPAIFDDYQKFMVGNSQIKTLVQSYEGRSFFITLDKRAKFYEAKNIENQQELYEKVQQITQTIFINEGITSEEKKLPDNIQNEIQALKKTLPNRAMPKITTPAGVVLPDVATLPDNIEQAIIIAAKARIKDQTQSADAKLDLTVQAKDLGIYEPRILPGNSLYQIKKITRLIQLGLTFDPLQKAELLIKQDNIKTFEAAKLIESSNSRETIDQSLALLEEVQKDFAKLKEHTKDLTVLKAKNSKGVDLLIDHIIANGLARQTVFSAIEAKVTGSDFVRVEKMRQDVLKDGIDSLLELTDGNATLLTQKVEQAVNSKTSNSKFKDLKALELLTEIKRFQPKEVDEVLEDLEIRLVKNFETKLLELPKKEREQQLLSYVESSSGNPVRQFETYEQLRDNLINPELLILTEELKDKAVENLNDRINEITDGSTLQEFVDDVIGNQPEDLKIIVDIELRVTPPEGGLNTESLPIVEKVREILSQIEENIIDAYKDNPGGIAQSDFFANPSHVDNVSIIDVKVAEQLEETLARSPEVSPEVVTAVEELKTETINQFVENLSNVNLSSSKEALQILEPTPQIISELIDLKEEVPESVDAKIDIAIATQIEILQDYLTNDVTDPQTFEIYIAQIQENPEVLQTIINVGGIDFTQAINETTQEIITTSTTDQIILETTIAEIEKEIFSEASTNGSVVDTFTLSVQEEILQIKEELAIEQILEVPVKVAPVIIPTSEPIQIIESTAPAPVQEPQAPSVGL